MDGWMVQNLSYHYVIGLASEKNTVKTCNSWLLPHITIQPLTPAVNLSKEHNY